MVGLQAVVVEQAGLVATILVMAAQAATVYHLILLDLQCGTVVVVQPAATVMWDEADEAAAAMVILEQPLQD